MFGVASQELCVGGRVRGTLAGGPLSAPPSNSNGDDRFGALARSKVAGDLCGLVLGVESVNVGDVPAIVLVDEVEKDPYLPKCVVGRGLRDEKTMACVSLSQIMSHESMASAVAGEYTPFSSTIVKSFFRSESESAGLNAFMDATNASFDLKDVLLAGCSAREMAVTMQKRAMQMLVFTVRVRDLTNPSSATGRAKAKLDHQYSPTRPTCSLERVVRRSGHRP